MQQDTELWDPEGDTLIYFGRQYQQAAFRLPSSILKRSKSKILLDLLHDGRRGRRENDRPSIDDAHSSRVVVVGGATTATTSSASSSVTYSQLDFNMLRESTNVKARKTYSALSLSTGRGNGGDDDEYPALYDVYISAPPKMSRPATIRYHLTTRNVLALLSNKAPVGLDFGQALTDLQRRLEEYMPPEVNCAKLVVRYLVSRQLHNVSNSPGVAAGLLSWSEGPTVRWQEGWRESFVHCCGMYPRLNAHPEWEHVTDVTRGLLRDAHGELQARIRSAEDRLLTFNFDDVWQVGEAHHHPSRAGFNSFRTFLRQHFEKTYRSWRARVREEHCADSWLTRELVNDLQEDHGALYDFLVDRNMVWSPSSGVARKDKTALVGADADSTPITNVLTAFDLKQGYTPILHPYPLLPKSIPADKSASTTTEPQTSRRLASFAANLGNRTSRARDKLVAQEYATASNLARLTQQQQQQQQEADSFTALPRVNALVEAFRKHEKSDPTTRRTDPRDARKGRWILLYGVLQVLAGISVRHPAPVLHRGALLPQPAADQHSALARGRETAAAAAGREDGRRLVRRGFAAVEPLLDGA